MPSIKKKINVIYWNNIPSPYMVERFNAIADRGNINFEAWFNERTHSDRSWKINESVWRFKYRYMPSIEFAGERLRFPLPLLARKKPDVLISLYAEPCFMAGWMIARIRRIKTGFRVLMTHDRWVKRNWIKERLKHYLFTRVDTVETPGADGKAFAMRYGAPENRIFYATHTVDIDYFKKIRKIALLERDRFRNKLGVCGTTFVYVGRLWWGKGIRTLLEAFSKVQQRVGDCVSLLIVGDGEDESYLRQQCATQGIKNVIFTGFKQKNELPYYYTAADVFVFPTLGDPYGLVVDEAMACHLPIISSSAAGEIRYRVDENVNGYIVPPEDSDILANRMINLALDVEIRTKMGRESALKVKDHTPQQWAKDFECGIQGIINNDYIK